MMAQQPGDGGQQQQPQPLGVAAQIAAQEAQDAAGECPYGHLSFAPGDPVAARLGVGAVALRYAALGLAVFPLRPGDKRPATEHGFLDATTDPAVIERWWAGNRALNVGIATGQASGGLLVTNLDRKNGIDGVASFTAWLAGNGLQIPLALPRAPSRAGCICSWGRAAGKCGPGPSSCRASMVRGDGGYVAAWPSGIRVWSGSRSAKARLTPRSGMCGSRS